MNNKDKLTIAYRGGFSDRNGIEPINTTIQMTDFDERTRVSLANYFCAVFTDMSNELPLNDWMNQLYLDMMWHVFVRQVKPSHLMVVIVKNEIEDSVIEVIRTGEYHDVLTIIEYIANKMEKVYSEFEDNHDIQKGFNDIFKREYVGYRFVDGIITRITNEIEIDSIDEAISSPYDNISKHIRKALERFADREKPDYENSIKESILAVEAICRIIANNDKATLGEALKEIKKKGEYNIHPSLEEAFKHIYMDIQVMINLVLDTLLE